MPYSTNDELPEPIKGVLPADAQNVFRGAFNSAWDGTCATSANREECAMKVAWAAVNGAGFSKGADGKWVKAQEPSKTEDGPKLSSRPLTISSVERKLLENFVDLKDGTLFQDVVLLTEGVWTDAYRRTPLNYSKELLQKYATNWKLNGYWTTHNPERAITDKVGEIRNPHFQVLGNGKGAVMGDVWVHNLTGNSQDTIALLKNDVVKRISVEHSSNERYNSEMGYYEAIDLTFYGAAAVEAGACQDAIMNAAYQGVPFNHFHPDCKKGVCTPHDIVFRSLERGSAMSAEMKKKLESIQTLLKEVLGSFPADENVPNPDEPKQMEKPKEQAPASTTPAEPAPKDGAPEATKLSDALVKELKATVEAQTKQLSEANERLVKLEKTPAPRALASSDNARVALGAPNDGIVVNRATGEIYHA